MHKMIENNMKKYKKLQKKPIKFKKIKIKQTNMSMKKK